MSRAKMALLAGGTALGVVGALIGAGIVGIGFVAVMIGRQNDLFDEDE